MSTATEIAQERTAQILMLTLCKCWEGTTPEEIMAFTREARRIGWQHDVKTRGLSFAKSVRKVERTIVLKDFLQIEDRATALASLDAVLPEAED